MIFSVLYFDILDFPLNFISKEGLTRIENRRWVGWTSTLLGTPTTQMIKLLREYS